MSADDTFSHKAELAGLGVLGAPSVVEAYHHARGTHPTGAVGKWLTHSGKPITEIVGLGILGAPSAMHLLRARKAPPTKTAGTALWKSASAALARRMGA